jgi:site-specific DNA recombinase
LLDLVENRAIHAVICFDPDRLTRNLGHLLFLQETFKQFDVQLHYCAYTRSGGAEGELLDTVRGAVAVFERAKFMERSWRGKVKRAKEGLPMLGKAIPYGYRYIPANDRHAGCLEIEPTEAAVVKRIFAMRVQGYGVWRIVKLLSAERVPTKRHLGQGISEKTRPPGVWAPSTVHRMLHNTTYIGHLAWNKRAFYAPEQTNRRRPANPKRLKTSCKTNPQEQWITMVVPPIIDPATFEAVQHLMNDHKKTNPRRRKHEYLFLAGRLRCGACGHSLSGYYDGRKATRFYQCTSSRNDPQKRCYTRVKAEHVETFVWMVVHDTVLDEPDAFRRKLQDRLTTIAQSQAVTKQDLDTIEHGIERCRQRLRRFQDLYANEGLTLEEFKERRAEIDGEIASLKKFQAEMQAEIHRAERQHEDISAAVAFVNGVSNSVVSIQDLAEQRKVLELLGVRATYHNGEINIQMRLYLKDDPYEHLATSGLPSTLLLLGRG